MIYEARNGESKFNFFERTYSSNADTTYVFNGVQLHINRGTTTSTLAARLHDAMCRIQQLEKIIGEN